MQKSNGYNMMRYTAFSSRCPVCVEPTNPPCSIIVLNPNVEQTTILPVKVCL